MKKRKTHPIVENLLAVTRLWWAFFWVAFEGMREMDEALTYAQKQKFSRSGVHCKNMAAYNLWEDLDTELRRLVSRFRARADKELRGEVVPGRDYSPK